MLELDKPVIISLQIYNILKTFTFWSLEFIANVQ